VGRVGSCPASISARPDPNDPLTHFVIVRSDLPIGVIAAQLVHAAGESSPGNLSEGTYAVVLAVPHEEALRKLAERLSRLGIGHTCITEPDAPYDGALMALGLFPRPRSELRRHLSELPLFRGSKIMSEWPRPKASPQGETAVCSRPSAQKEAATG